MEADQEKKMLSLLNEALHGEEKQIVILSKEEYSDLKKMLEDRKAIGRAWSIIKTILFGVAATIAAYNVIFEGGYKAISHLFGIGNK